MNDVMNDAMKFADDFSTLTRAQLIGRLQAQARLDDALRRSEERLKAYAEATFEGIVLTRQGVILECNPQLERMLGFSKEEMRGRSADEFIPPEHRERVMDNIRQGRDSQIVHDLLCRDGSRITVEARGRRVENMGPGDRFTVIRDITEQLQAKEALLKSEELSRSTLQALPAHIAVIASDGRIIAVNQAWADFARCNDAGDSPQVAVGAPYLDIVQRAAVTGDADAVAAVAGIERVLAGSLPQFTLEYPCHAPHQQRWFLMTAVPLSAGAGGGLVITHLNITERKQAEDEQLAAMERQRDALVREVHHRIKNHLQGVSGMLRGMIDDHPHSRQPLEAAIARVQAIAQVYGLQSVREDARVRLCDLLRGSVECAMGAVMVDCHLPQPDVEVILAPVEAVPLALVISELMTNAAKHLDSINAARPVQVSLSLDGQVVRAVFRSGPAHLPPSFDFAGKRGLGTGLELVAALLPAKGARLSYRQAGDEVIAELALEAPAVSISSAP